MSTATEDIPQTTDPAEAVDAAKAFFSTKPETKPAEITSTETKPTETAPSEASSVVSSVLKSPSKADEKTAETKPAVDETELTKDIEALKGPDDKSPAAPGWKELKSLTKQARIRAAQLERENAELKAKLETVAKTAPADDATWSRLSELETQNKQLSERLRVVDVRSHPEFEQKFVQPVAKAKMVIGDLLKTEEVQADVDTILALKGKKFNEAVSEVMEQLTPFGRAKFQGQLDQILTAQAGAEQALQEADAFLKSAKQRSGSANRAAFDQVGAQFQGLFVPQPVDEKAPDGEKAKLAEYNQALSEVSKTAEQYAFNSLTETQAAELAHKAALFDFVVTRGIPRIGELVDKELTAAKSRVAELEAKVKELTAASPNPVASSGAGHPAGSETPPTEQDHLTAARAYFK